MRSTSRVTAQNQISIPAAVRRKFRIVPGTELVWEDRGEELVVRPKRYTLEEIRAVCAERPVSRLTLRQMRAARDRAVVRKYGRRS